MGWLRNLMDAAEPAVPSFGKLADLALNHPGWPDHTRPKSRSLATLLSKMDHEQELDWLRDRADVQLVLAEVLSRPLSEIRLALGEVGSQGSPRHLRLHDVRYARDLDLVQEALPPGIPSDVISPPHWGPTWWLAPPGSGRTMVARWLQARGLCHAVSIRSAQDLERLPSRGPLYVELEGPQVRLEDVTLAALRRESRPVCVAAAHTPQEDWGFQLVESPGLEHFLPELVDWVAARLDESGNFNPDRAEQWMRRVFLPQAPAATLGDALGVMGALDEMNPRTMLGKSLDELGAHFVRKRMREALEKASSNPRLSEEAYPALCHAAARALVTGNDALALCHARDEWVTLLSQEREQDAPDPEWFAEALRGSLGAQISRRELRRAAHRLEPGAFSLVRGMESAGLLMTPQNISGHNANDAQRELRPTWLTTLLMARSHRETLRLSCSAWGMALFGPHDEEILSALLTEVRSGHLHSVFQLVDEFDPTLPAHVAALEGSVIACSLAQMAGDELPEELVSALLEHTADTLAVIDGLPVPRWVKERSSGDAYCFDLWLVGLTALTVEHAFPLQHLDPHRSNRPDLRAYFVLSHERLLSLHDSPAYLSESRAASFVDQLLSLEDSAAGAAPLNELVNNWGRLKRAQLEAALSLLRFDHLHAYLFKGGLSERAIFAQIWNLQGEEAEPAAIYDRAKLQARLWTEAPTAILRQRMRSGSPIPWEKLEPHQFSSLLNQRADCEVPQQVCLHAPLDTLLLYLETHGPRAFASAALAVLLDRARQRVAPAIQALLSAQRTDELSYLLDCVPAAASEAILDCLPNPQEMLAWHSSQLSILRRFLRRVVAGRHPNFRRSYDVWAQLEQGVFALRTMS